MKNIKQNIIELENIKLKRKYSVSHLNSILSDITYNLNQLPNSINQHGGDSITELQALDIRIDNLKTTINDTLNNRDINNVVDTLNKVIQQFNDNDNNNEN